MEKKNWFSDKEIYVKGYDRDNVDKYQRETVETLKCYDYSTIDNVLEKANEIKTKYGNMDLKLRWERGDEDNEVDEPYLVIEVSGYRLKTQSELDREAQEQKEWLELSEKRTQEEYDRKKLELDRLAQQLKVKRP